jgi:hypothetical protein
MLTGAIIGVVDFERHPCTGDSWAGAVLLSFGFTTSVNNIDENLCDLDLSCAYTVLQLSTFLSILKIRDRICRHMWGLSYGHCLPNGLR